MERNQIRKLIPQGYCKIIATRAGVSTKTVSCYMTGKSQSFAVEIAALQILDEIGKSQNRVAIDRDAIRKKIPYGFLLKIAKKAGVSSTRVSQYFMSRTLRSPKIERAIVQIVAEIDELKNPLLERIL